MLNIKVVKNLRRAILRGHPWVYQDAIASPGRLDRAQLCKISDSKGELGWGIYDPHSPLAVRVLSHERRPPNAEFFRIAFARALKLRHSFLTPDTSGYRLFNGEGDLLPGFVCDIYADTAVVQFDGIGPAEFWERELITSWLLKTLGVKTIFEKPQRERGKLLHLAGAARPSEVEIEENGIKYLVDLEKGQKTGFFFDQRDNREFIGRIMNGGEVLNLFSYTGGFSAAAGVGGARHVTSVDIASGAIELANKNWALNDLNPEDHRGVCADVFEFLKSSSEDFSHIIVDPPSMAHSEADKEAAMGKYIEAFSAAATCVAPGGQLSLSSCSSHISFDDFFEIIAETLSNSRRRGQVVRVSGQGADHPYPHACPELRYLKFVHLNLD